MKDEEGRVTINSFYDDVVLLTDSEIEAIQRVPRIEQDLCRRFNIPKPEMWGKSLQELLNLPTLNVRGMQGGGVGENGRNIVPATAHAEFDVRLVKGMDPDVTFQRVVAHARRQGWTVHQEPVVQADLPTAEKCIYLEKRAGFPAVRTPLDSPAGAYVVTAVQRALGENIVILPIEGGSLPLYLFERMGMPVIGLLTSNYDCNQHTHDENLLLQNFSWAIEIFASLFVENDTQKEHPGLA